MRLHDRAFEERAFRALRAGRAVDQLRVLPDPDMRRFEAAFSRRANISRINGLVELARVLVQYGLHKLLREKAGHE
jgi:hypothetical protein